MNSEIQRKQFPKNLVILLGENLCEQAKNQKARADIQITAVTPRDSKGQVKKRSEDYVDYEPSNSVARPITGCSSHYLPPRSVFSPPASWASSSLATSVFILPYGISLVI